LEPSESTFRQSLITKIHRRTEEIVLSLALATIEAASEANKSPSARKVDKKSEYGPTPFLLLIILLEQPLLFPSNKAGELNESSLHSERCRRVRLFRSG